MPYTSTSAVISISLALSMTACGGGSESIGSAAEEIELNASLNSEQDVLLDAWTEGEQYALNDTITFEGHTYINIEPTSGQEDPSDSRYWQLLEVDSFESPIVESSDNAIIIETQAASPVQMVEVNEINPLTTENMGNATASALQISAPLRSVSLNWQGNYTSGTSYQLNDLVAYQGRSYIATQATDGIQKPTDTNHWSLLADKGSDGAQGIAGATGATGAQGPTGATGERGIPGVQGEQGPIGLTGPPGTDGAQGVAGPIGPAGPIGTAGLDGLDGLDGSDGLDGDDAPSRTAELCGLYENLIDSRLLYDLTLPTYCPNYVAPNYSVGDEGPAGGIVFYITDGGKHGIEVAPETIGTNRWCWDDLAESSAANGLDIGTGNQNTMDMLVERCPGATYATSYNGPYQNFSGWYLPSINEALLFADTIRELEGANYDAQEQTIYMTSSVYASYGSVYGVYAVDTTYNPSYRFIASPNDINSVRPVRRF